MPREYKDKVIRIRFDGVYMNAEFWLNGEFLGWHPYGYTSFWFDLTDKIKFGEKNVLSVKVKNEGQNCRWYTGSGIYRHVWMDILEPVHIAPWGTYITTPSVSAKTAEVRIRTRVLNKTSEDMSIELVTRILRMETSTVLLQGCTLDGKPGLGFRKTT
jgi:beta-galactosidase